MYTCSNICCGDLAQYKAPMKLSSGDKAKCGVWFAGAQATIGASLTAMFASIREAIMAWNSKTQACAREGYAGDDNC